MKTPNSNKEQIKILLLDSSPISAVEAFKSDGYTNIKYLDDGLDEDTLAKTLQDVHIVGIRSKTKITAKALANAKNLMAIGRFGIGVNNVDLKTAEKMGVPVFNSPFANTRSVAELVIGNIFNLFRGISEKSMGAHNGQWLKSSTNAHEVRGKKLGIIGYSNIGTQVSVMAEAIGMEVYYYDIEDKLPIGNAKQIKSLNELLRISDIVTLHVPGIKSTENLISFEELEIMKSGSYLINTSRGNVVDEEALVKALKDKHLNGVALDVFCQEPKSKNEPFESLFKKLPNVIMTPHIGGSTIEAQENIGAEVVSKLIKYLNSGSSFGAVNFPQVNLSQLDKKHRVIHIHDNVPGILAAINDIFSNHKLNISAQYLQTNNNIGFVVSDIDKIDNYEQILDEMHKIKGTIKTRILY